ncbi:NAD-dependent epimerase/dehydratase family protein [Tautonia rosea]|uniref:NAD-dependent epimerase/dehydratase family protein n=1 Tax=Tautonia rosea TaxID=2728037 RepID=UPI0028F41B67|nr:NAD-dependent epimerase/dehydratase family protein [Tautonia rosea]
MPAITPGDWPVLVTGAGGFVGGHVARALSRAGHPVRGLARRPPAIEPDDPLIAWQIGDLLDPATRRAAVRGMRAVIHAAGWVSLGPDDEDLARLVNVEATRALLDEADAAGVERFVFTSTLHTVAAGTSDEPADEQTPWNLHPVDSPYARTKREAEAMVLSGIGDRMQTLAICPGMVVGPRDIRPTSTGLLLIMARTPVVVIPGGGIPIVDASVIAQAHRAALSLGEPGRRYAVVGPYLSYTEMARLVSQITGRPRVIHRLPDAAHRPMRYSYAAGGLISRRLRAIGSPALVAGAFLRLHVRGDLADATFGLAHPDPIVTIRSALADAYHSGRAPWLRLRPEPSA